MKEFSDPKYKVDVLKVEVPVNMNYGEGYSDGEIAYSKKKKQRHSSRNKVMQHRYHLSS